MNIAAILVILLAQAAGQTRLQTGTIRGEIRGVEGSPAVGVRVSAVPVPSDGNAADVMIVLSQTDASGRYVLEGIPPGRYVIAAGLVDTPNYYPGVSSMDAARILNVTAGATTGGIDFTLALSPGVRVRGRLQGYPAAAPGGLIRVAMIGRPGSGRSLESPVAVDGTFEFLRVPPGNYDLRVAPGMNATSSRVEVQNKDIDSIILEAGILLPGKLAVDDGSPLPQMMEIPDSPARVRLFTLPLNTQSRAGSAVTPVRASDGAFFAMLSEGEYRIGTIQLPLGYFVQSISLGSLDLLQSSLKVTKALSDQPVEIRVTLTRTPPKNGPVQRTISGRVFGVPAGLHGQYKVVAENATTLSQALALSGAQRTGEASIRADGTFEIPNVLPDTYALRVFHPSQGTMSEVAGIVVSDTDASGVELVAPPLQSPSSGAPVPVPPPANPLQPPVLPPAQPAGVRVSGVVTLAGINARMLMPHSIVLFGARFSGRSFQIPLSPEGAFEFASVPPGEYDLRPLPLALPAVSTHVVVESQEIKDVRIALPPQSDVRGIVQTQDGGALPALKGAILKLESPVIELVVPVGDDGRFTARLAHGEYRYSSIGVPEGYAVIPGVLRVNAAGVQDVRMELRR